MRLAQSTIKELTTPIMTSSGTSLPESINSFARFPTSVPADTAARNMSPVLRWTTPYLALIDSHCVPFPLAGAPAMINLGAAFPPPPTARAGEGSDSDTAAAAEVAVPWPRASDQVVRDATLRLFLLASSAVG